MPDLRSGTLELARGRRPCGVLTADSSIEEKLILIAYNIPVFDEHCDYFQNNLIIFLIKKKHV